MKLLKNKPIRTKLKLVILSTSLLSIVLVFTGFFIYENITYKEILLNDLWTKADIIAENSNAALAFSDSADASEVLKSLASQPHIIAAAIYDQQEQIFATYTRPGQEKTLPTKAEPEGWRFEEEALVVSKAVKLNGTPIGMIYVTMDLEGRRERFQSYIQIAFLVLVGSLAVAFLVATALEKNISGPIVSLAKTARQVSEDQDYSIRAYKITDDETGSLADAVNHMLAKIQERDEDLRRTNEEMAAEIAERKHAEISLREREQRLSSIYDTTADIIFHLEVEKSGGYRFISVNKAFVTTTGIDSTHVVGKLVNEIIPEPSLTMVMEKYGEAIREKKIVRWEETSEYPTGRLTGEVSVAPVFDDSGNCTHLVGAVHDISERKRAEEEIRKLNEELEQKVLRRTVQLETANKELEAFSYSVSHDLRAPLRHIDGFAQMLQKHYSDSIHEKGKRYIDTISDAAKVMGQLIDELLVFSRMGRTEMKKADVPMERLVHDVLKELNHETEGRNLRLTVGRLPDVKGDYAMLKLVWMNLLSNAIKYTQKKDAPIVDVGYKEEDLEYIFFVRDNGAGFDMKYENKLFGVFQRLHRTEEFEGTGIGLANVKRIVLRHNGRVWAEGAVGQGATFYFSMPKTGGNNG